MNGFFPRRVIPLGTIRDKRMTAPMRNRKKAISVAAIAGETNLMSTSVRAKKKAERTINVKPLVNMSLTIANIS